MLSSRWQTIKIIKLEFTGAVAMSDNVVDVLAVVIPLMDLEGEDGELPVLGVVTWNSGEPIPCILRTY